MTKKDRTSATTSLLSSFDNEEWDFSEPPPPVDDRDEEWFRFSMSELPAWAQKRMVESRPSMATHVITDQKDSTDQETIGVPSGAWAEVCDTDPLLYRVILHINFSASCWPSVQYFRYVVHM